MKSPCQPEIGKFYDEKVKAKLVFLDLFRSFAEEEYIWLIGLKYGLDDNDIISA